jgi:hypothetical protein
MTRIGDGPGAMVGASGTDREIAERRPSDPTSIRPPQRWRRRPIRGRPSSRAIRAAMRFLAPRPPQGPVMLDWHPRAKPHPADPAAAAADRERRILIARDIWSQARPAAGTVVDRYIRARGISLPIPPAIGYLPPGDRYAWHSPSGERRPVMVARVDHVEHGLVAVHRTWLTPDGSGKAMLNPERMTLGPIGDAAVQLAPLRPGVPLVIAEASSRRSRRASCCTAGRPGRR